MLELTTWKNKETRLENYRKNAIDRGASSDQSIADTAVDQKKNNRLYDQIMKKSNHRRTVNMFV